MVELRTCYYLYSTVHVRTLMITLTTVPMVQYEDGLLNLVYLSTSNKLQYL